MHLEVSELLVCYEHSCTVNAVINADFDSFDISSIEIAKLTAF